MVIAITMFLVMAMALAVLAAGRLLARLPKRRTGQGRKAPGDQIRPLPRHAPLVDSQVYS